MGSSWDAMTAVLTPKDELERGMRGIDITMARGQLEAWQRARWERVGAITAGVRWGTRCSLERGKARRLATTGTCSDGHAGWASCLLWLLLGDNGDFGDYGDLGEQVGPFCPRIVLGGGGRAFRKRAGLDGARQASDRAEKCTRTSKLWTATQTRACGRPAGNWGVKEREGAVKG